MPKGPSLDPAVKRLAVAVADHGLDAADFEGVHAGATRGTGAVIIWDEGSFDLRTRRAGHLSFVLHGSRLRGGFALTRTGGDGWILVKMRDDDARPGSDVVAEHPTSIRSGRTWQQVAAEPTVHSAPTTGASNRDSSPRTGDEPHLDS